MCQGMRNRWQCFFFQRIDHLLSRKGLEICGAVTLPRLARHNDAAQMPAPALRGQILFGYEDGETDGCRSPARYHWPGALRAYRAADHRAKLPGARVAWRAYRAADHRAAAPGAEPRCPAPRRHRPEPLRWRRRWSRCGGAPGCRRPSVTSPARAHDFSVRRFLESGNGARFGAPGCGQWRRR